MYVRVLDAYWWEGIIKVEVGKRLATYRQETLDFVQFTLINQASHIIW